LRKRVAAKPTAKAAPRKSAGWRRGELRRGGHQLLEILLTQRIGEMLDLTGGAVDVFRDLRLVLTTHLAAGVMEGRGDRIEGAGQPLLLGAELGGELRGRLLASGVDELTGLFLGLADDLVPCWAMPSPAVLPPVDAPRFWELDPPPDMPELDAPDPDCSLRVDSPDWAIDHSFGRKPQRLRSSQHMLHNLCRYLMSPAALLWMDVL
jgi:hypothetical protein